MKGVRRSDGGLERKYRENGGGISDIQNMKLINESNGF